MKIVGGQGGEVEDSYAGELHVTIWYYTFKVQVLENIFCFPFWWWEYWFNSDAIITCIICFNAYKDMAGKEPDS